MYFLLSPDRPLQPNIFHLHGDMTTWLPCLSDANPGPESELFLCQTKRALNVFPDLSLYPSPLLLSSFSPLFFPLSPPCTQECFVSARDKRNKRHHWQKNDSVSIHLCDCPVCVCARACVCTHTHAHIQYLCSHGIIWKWDCNYSNNSMCMSDAVGVREWLCMHVCRKITLEKWAQFCVCVCLFVHVQERARERVTERITKQWKGGEKNFGLPSCLTWRKNTPSPSNPFWSSGVAKTLNDAPELETFPLTPPHHNHHHLLPC